MALVSSVIDTCVERISTKTITKCCRLDQMTNLLHMTSGVALDWQLFTSKNGQNAISDETKHFIYWH